MITVSNVVNASKGELLCITYELFLEQIELAKKSEESEKRKAAIQKSIKILQMLVNDLNFEYEISKELFSIYVYVQGLLINAKDNQKLDEAYKLIHKIYSAFKQVAQQETTKQPVMQNAEVVYAGLTYGKGTINETVMKNEGRGFRA